MNARPSPSGQRTSYGPSARPSSAPSPEPGSQSGRLSYVLTSREKRQAVAQTVATLPKGWRIECKAPKRTLPQNSLLWTWLTAFAEQAEWAGKKRTTLEWKDLFTAAVKVAGGGVEAVPGLEGGLMLLGLHTSDMSVAEMADLITYMEVKAAEWGVSLDHDGSRDAAGGGESPKPAARAA